MQEMKQTVVNTINIYQLISRLVIDFITSGDERAWKGYLLAVALLLMNLTNAIVFNMYFKYTYIAGMRTRSAIIAAVYRKVLSRNWKHKYVCIAQPKCCNQRDNKSGCIAQPNRCTQTATICWIVAKKQLFCIYLREVTLYALFQALRLTNASRRTTTVGEIVNLMSIDAQKLHDVCNNMHEIWACPIIVVVSMVLLWQVNLCQYHVS